MEKVATCLKCGQPIEPAPMGRPRAYCSTACRRAAEFEIRRIVRRLERLEDRLAELQHSPDQGIRDWRGRTHDQAIAAAAGEIAEAEERLRALLEGGAKA